jgi:cobalt/nickel transport system permease protein
MVHVIAQSDRDHCLSKIDPRVKLFVGTATLAMVLSHGGVLFPLAVALISLLLCAWIGIPPKTILLRFSEPLFIGLVILLIKLFSSGQQPLFTLQIFGIEVFAYREGLHEGLLIGSRIAGAVSLLGVIGFSTPFSELMAALAWYRVPKTLIDIAMFAYRYIFMLLEDALVIYQAQKNRLGYSSVRRGLTSFGILTGSLTLRAFEHSQAITSSMMQRGYDGTMPVMRHKPFRKWDIICSTLLVAALGLLWRIR